MAGQDLNVQIRISADGTAAVTGVNRVDAALDELNRSANAAGGGVDALTNTLLQLNLGERILSEVVARMGEVAQMADEWNNLQARIKLVTGGSEEAAAALDGVRRVASATRTDVSAAGDLYTTLARSLKSLGDETTNAVDLTETIAQAMALSGRGASENRSAITQLSQALASGVLRGDEFNSMMENAPRLIQALADALGTTTGSLRAMAEEGKLTANLLVSAFKNQAKVIDAEFQQLPLTISGAMTNVGNAVKGMIGDFDDASASSEVVAQAIQSVADHLDEVATVAAGAGLAAVAAGAAQAATAMTGLATATLAARNARAELAVAERMALAVTAETLVANQAAAVSYVERAAAAVAAARLEVAAAKQAAVAAQENLLLMQQMAVYGPARAAAEREVTAALQARTLAEQKLALALQEEAAAANNSALAAAAASRAQAAAAATTGIWTRANTFLNASLGLLKSPLNAMTGAITAIMAYDFGKWMADASKEAQAWYNPLTLIKNVLGGMEWSMRKLSSTYDAQRESEDRLQETQRKSQETLKLVQEQTGLAFDSMTDLSNASEKGAVIFDRAGNTWRRGAVSLETARSAVTALDAALQTQGKAIEEVTKREEVAAKVAAQRRELSIKIAAALGDEQRALTLAAQARQADVTAAARALDLAKGDLANSEERLASMIAEAKAGKGLTEQKQAAINALTNEVEAKRQAVAAGQIAVETARLEANEAARLASAEHQVTVARERELAVIQRQIQAAQEEGALRVTHLRNLAQEAAARGDVVGSARYQRKAVEAEIDSLQRLLTIKQAEIATAAAALVAKRAEAALDGINPEEEAALKLLQETVDGKQREAAAIQEAIRAKQAEAQIMGKSAQAMREAGGAGARLRAEMGGLGDGIDDVSDAQERNQSVSHSWSESLALNAQWAGVATDAIGQYTAEAERAYAAAKTANQEVNTYLASLIDNGRSMAPVMSSVGDAFKALAREEVEAANQAARMAGAYDAMQAKIQDLQDRFDQGDLGLSAYIARLNSLIAANHGLGEERLQPLRDALRDARQQMEDFTQSARDGLSSLQIEWAQLNNRQSEVENLQYQQDRIELEQQITEARKAGNQEALAALQQQMGLLNQIHAKKLSDIETEQAAQAAQAASTQGQTAQAQPVAMPQYVPIQTVEIKLPNGAKANVIPGQERDVIASFEQFAASMVI